MSKTKIIYNTTLTELPIGCGYDDNTYGIPYSIGCPFIGVCFERFGKEKMFAAKRGERPDFCPCEEIHIKSTK